MVYHGDEASLRWRSAFTDEDAAMQWMGFDIRLITWLCVFVVRLCCVKLMCVIIVQIRFIIKRMLDVIKPITLSNDYCSLDAITATFFSDHASVHNHHTLPASSASDLRRVRRMFTASSTDPAVRMYHRVLLHDSGRGTST